MIDPVVRGRVSEKFGRTNKKDVSLQCLELADKWLAVKQQQYGDSFLLKAKRKVRSSDRATKSYFSKQYKQECKQYVIDNFDRSKVKGSLILSLFLPMIIKFVASYIVNMIIDRWSEDN